MCLFNMIIFDKSYSHQLHFYLEQLFYPLKLGILAKRSLIRGIFWVNDLLDKETHRK